MNKAIEIKKQIFNQIILIFEERIEMAQLAVNSAKESRDNEPKCSAGDKYQTDRTMMQTELEKNRVQLNKILNMKNELLKIDLQKNYNKIEYGSLVLTESGNYFMSTGLGKISLGNKKYFAISFASPMGKLLHNKKAGDKFIFMGKEIVISDVI